ncbi:T9SS type A sorting domain-containing protein [Segetibacter sp.]|uniref:T9SS type A sorting domain-containing protein n=1 Tax=Segetibacter sp. TaxID=2231182 RepID=UPI002615D852|nr:T9SS type A sorting domain-containing protein [Segetibacter sp.]MCW3079452.1 Alkaline phosphatase [Segetibacter sp.]
MKKLILILLLAIPAFELAAQTVFPFGSSWKYLDDGSNQGSAWTGLNYDDSNWKSGTGELGYGDGDESTVISYGSNPRKKHITTYFRRIEHCGDPSFFSSFLSEIKRDDGVVVYLNGVEIFRDNMPAGPLSYNTFAASLSNDRSNIRSFTTSASLVLKGNNVIAVEIHQFTHSSNDISFDMRVTANPVVSDPTSIPFSSWWKYLDDGSNQGNSWTGISFSDASWKSGPAILGYGNRNESTVVSFGPDPNNKYITTYFRRTISLQNPEAFKKYSFSVKRDDGVIVYINSKEVYRNNMPSGPISYTTLALGSVDENGLLRTFNINASAFTTGINVVAVEIHQSNPTSTDIAFDLSLEGFVEPPEQARIISGPFIEKITETTASIRWTTNLPTDSKAEVGTIYGNYIVSATDNNIATEHQLQVAGLLKNTKYYYRIGASTSGWLVGSVLDFFTTASTDGTSRNSNIDVTPAKIVGQSKGLDTKDGDIKSIKDPGIKLFPSLIKKGKSVTIRASTREILDAFLLDANGRLIHSFKILNTIYLDTKDLPAGAYFVTFRNKSKIRTHRFVVAN